MKKALVFILLSLGFCINNTQAQTMEQTIDWLNSKTGLIPYTAQAKFFSLKPIYPNDVQLVFPQMQNNSGWVEDLRRINLSKVTRITFNTFKEGQGFNLYLSGPTDKITRLYSSGSSTGLFTEIEELANTQYIQGAYNLLRLEYGVTEDEIKQIKKAYEHLAKLCGAKLVSDDLFKN